MALWGKTDASASAPKYLLDSANTDIVPLADAARDYNGLPEQLDVNNTFFVDKTEATISSNRAAGIRTPGWNLIYTYTDSEGNTRRKIESLVPMKVSASDAGDAEDVVVVDRIISISVQPANVSVVESNTAVFSVTAAASPSSALSYQWQIQQSGTGAWANVATGSGGTTATYTTGATAVAAGSGATNGDKYRVIVSAAGAASVTSNAATLTVTAAE